MGTGIIHEIAMTPTRYEYRYRGRDIIQYELPDGSLHREDGPAYIVEYDDGEYVEEWFYDGHEHRYGGPAVQYLSGNMNYFIHGINVSVEVIDWLKEHDYEWETMSDIEKWELEMFMRSL